MDHSCEYRKLTCSYCIAPYRLAMSEHTHRTTTRHCEVAVVGGSAAGLAAALQIGRQRRSVIVIDAGDPRNAPAAHMHGYLGREGTAPAELTRIGRAEVRSHGGEVLAGLVVDVSCREDGEFAVTLDSGTVVVARRVLAATGLTDELPDVDGLADHWGRDVVHCPFCHGYEVRDQRIVVLATHAAGAHQATLFRQLTDRLTVVVHDGVSPADFDDLRASGVDVVPGSAARVVEGTDGRLEGIELTDGRRLALDALVVGPRFRSRIDAFAGVGLTTTPHPTGLGEMVDIDERGQTVVPGLYAAGNVTDPSLQVLGAAAAGSRTGAMISADLAAEDVRTVTRRSGNEVDWEHRYHGDPIWSGNPNGSLVVEAEHLAPGRALDVGAGEGADAIWLAEHGWTVTASDISERALGRIGTEAERRGLDVARLRADANAHDPFTGEVFDLVCAQYASIPRTPDDRGIGNLLGAVAPGGTLIAVGHRFDVDLASPGSPPAGGAFDVAAYVQVDDLAAAATSAGWVIEVHETRPRPAGAVTASQHVDDIVLRARRTTG